MNKNNEKLVNFMGKRKGTRLIDTAKAVKLTMDIKNNKTKINDIIEYFLLIRDEKCI